MLLRRGDEQTAVHLSDAADPRGADRMEQRVGNYRVEIIEPLRKLRLVMEETHGIAMDLTWEGSFDVVQELPHVMRQGSSTILDAQRFAQVGTWEGTIAVDGTDIAVTPDRWVGSRDRSWGIRPVGEAAPAGKPADPAFEGMWWLYVPMRFDDFCVVLIIQETPDGYRTLNDCTRVWKDGRVEQLGWPRAEIRYTSGTRVPTGATITCQTPEGKDLVLEVTSKLAGADPRRRRLRRRPRLDPWGLEGRRLHRAADVRHQRPGRRRSGDVRRDRPRRARGRTRARRRRRGGLGALRARSPRPA